MHFGLSFSFRSGTQLQTNDPNNKGCGRTAPGALYNTPSTPTSINTHQQHISEVQFVRHPIPDDGDCLFRAIHMGLNQAGAQASPRDIQKLRKRISDYVYKNQLALAAHPSFLGWGGVQELQSLLRAQGAWNANAGDLVPMLLAQVLGRDVMILQSQEGRDAYDVRQVFPAETPELPAGRGSVGEPPICLEYINDVEGEEHYNYLEPGERSNTHASNGVSIEQDPNTGKAKLSLNIELEDDNTVVDTKESTSVKKKVRRAVEYGAYAEALGFMKLRPLILGCATAALAISEITKNSSAKELLDLNAQILTSNAKNRIEQQFTEVKQNVDTRLQQSIFVDNTSAQQRVEPFNEMLLELSEAAVSENDRQRNATLTYLEDQSVAFAAIKEGLLSSKNDITGFSDEISTKADEISGLLNEIEQYATDNYSDAHADAAAAKASYDAAVARFTELMDDIADRIAHTCGNIRSQHGKGRVREKILDGAKSMCDDVESYINNNKNEDDSPDLSGNTLTPEGFESWINIKKGAITQGALNDIKQDASQLEKNITQSLDETLTTLSTLEQDSEKLQAELKNSTSSLAISGAEPLEEVAQVAEESRLNYFSESGRNYTEQQRANQNTINQIDQAMNKTLSEVIIPTLENITVNEIDALVSKYEESGELPIKILNWATAILSGLAIIATGKKMLEELEVPGASIIPAVPTRFEFDGKTGKGPAQVQASRELDRKHRGLKLETCWDVFKQLAKNLMTADFGIALSAYLTAVIYDNLSSDIGKQNLSSQSAKIDHAVDGLNVEIAGILEQAREERKNATVDYGQLNQDTIEHLYQSAETNEELAEGLEYLERLGILDDYVNLAIGEPYASEKNNFTDFGDGLTEASTLNVNLDDYYSDGDFNAFKKVIDDKVEGAKGKKEDSNQFQKNATLVLLAVTVINSVIKTLGQRKDVNILGKARGRGKRNMEPKDRFVRRGEKKEAVRSLAGIALTMNYHGLKVRDKPFLKADPGYMSGHKPAKKSNEQKSKGRFFNLFRKDKATEKSAEQNQVDIELANQVNSKKQKELSNKRKQMSNKQKELSNIKISESGSTPSRGLLGRDKRLVAEIDQEFPSV